MKLVIVSKIDVCWTAPCCSTELVNVEKPVCSLSDRTLCFIHWLSLRRGSTAGVGSDQSQCEQGQEAQPGAEGGAARAGLSWHHVLGPTGCR